MVYATEAIPLSRGSLRMLDDCIKHAIVKIFKVRDNDRPTIDAIRQYCDLPYIGVIVESRRMKFINKLLEIQHLACYFQSVFTVSL